jgi:hypothetical protein
MRVGESQEDSPTCRVENATGRAGSDGRMEDRLARALSKTLSENRQIEQDVDAGKLNKRQPVFSLLHPASTQTPALDEPRNRPLHHPSPRRVNLARRVVLRRVLTPFRSGIDLDVSDVALRSNELPQVL